MQTIIDTHVHLYDIFNVHNFFFRLNQNFNFIRQGTKNQEPQKVIVLTEGYYDSGFKRILSFFINENRINLKITHEYKLLGTDHNSFIHLDTAGENLIVVSGRQIIGRDNIEVLALGTTTEFNSNLNTEQIIEDVGKDGAIPVLPWGVGKWLGKRGKIVSQLLQNSNLPPFFIGDSANRPLFWPEPSQFRIAMENGISNLPGSDPLPVKNGYKNAGKAGIILKDSINLNKPVTSLQHKLLDPTSDIQPYMKRENPISFFRNQFAMQYKKHFGDENR